METADVVLCVNKIDKNFKTLLFLLKVIHISNSVLLLFLTGIQCKLLLIRILFQPVLWISLSVADNYLFCQCFVHYTEKISAKGHQIGLR